MIVLGKFMKTLAASSGKVNDSSHGCHSATLPLRDLGSDLKWIWGRDVRSGTLVCSPQIRHRPLHLLASRSVLRDLSPRHRLPRRHQNFDVGHHSNPSTNPHHSLHRHTIQACLTDLRSWVRVNTITPPRASALLGGNYGLPNCSVACESDCSR